ncbi:MAG TPA: FumA C-terminus/TtdB family hydratase beta subunit [Aggregatilineaceae bacterium]|jgi:fumarate hydratase class I|nr:FumA C-terminus/TtdB family hydratase beta subunit [Aggregatilineaceae bacterium]
MRKLTVPISEETIRELTVGEPVRLSGVIATGRDAAHKYIVENFVKTRGKPPEAEQAVYADLKRVLNESVIYHCGPVVQKTEDTWSFLAAGPTTSIREEPYQAAVIEHFKLRAVIGKGGMGLRTLQACQDFGAVYLHAIGGAATLIARSVREVVTVYKLEFGVPEAFWIIRVEDFPAVVTMDTHGNSLHEQIMLQSSAKLAELLKL